MIWQSFERKNYRNSAKTKNYQSTNQYVEFHEIFSKIESYCSGSIMMLKFLIKGKTNICHGKRNNKHQRNSLTYNDAHDKITGYYVDSFVK